MIEKITLHLNEEQGFCTGEHECCKDMNPKQLLLYAGAKCAALSAMGSLGRENIVPRRFEITLTGELSTDTLKPESEFKSFNVVYNLECATVEEQAKAGGAIKTAHEQYSGLMNMFRKIGPVTYDIAMVSTETE